MVDWRTPEQTSFMAAFADEYGETEPNTPERKALLDKVRDEWASHWELRADQKKVRLVSGQ